MKTSEILQAFHGMAACDRVDLLCRMLHHCVPYEAHFLGTCLLYTSDAADDLLCVDLGGGRII